MELLKGQNHHDRSCTPEPYSILLVGNPGRGFNAAQAAAARARTLSHTRTLTLRPQTCS